METELYTEQEMETVEKHIEQYFGGFKHIFHEIVSPDIHVDICVIPPTDEKHYYTLVTMGMGAHRMNVPPELAEFKLERAELAISLPADWKIDEEDERWYWPFRLLKVLARLPGSCDTWLGWGHVMDNEAPFAENTDLCAAMLIGPQRVKEGGDVCFLPGGEAVNFYQVIPLYRDEMEYKRENEAEALLRRMADISFVVYPDRSDAMDIGNPADVDLVMDDAKWHLETLLEKHLPVEEITAFNHLAIYLRWQIEHDLMSEQFLERYGDTVQRIKADPVHTDLRPFVRDELDGVLLPQMFNRRGEAFACYYYGDGDAPYFPSDIDDHAEQYFGPERYHSDEFKDEAYLFVPFDEDYYQAMAEVIGQRWSGWQNQEIDEVQAEPSALANAMMDYLGCECRYFPPMKDDDPIIAAYHYARRKGVREGFVPMLVAVDETLWECLMMNSDPGHDGADDYAFDRKTVDEYRLGLQNRPLKDGRAILEELLGGRKGEAEDDELDWDGEMVGEMSGGQANDRLLSCWDFGTDKTCPLILAQIPVKEPWQVFAWLPFGGWNECPGTEELMAVAKYWHKEHGAAPAALTHDELEFVLPKPVPKEAALRLACEHHGFCPDIDQNEESIGAHADGLWQSKAWYFWWD